MNTTGTESDARLGAPTKVDEIREELLSAEPTESDISTTRLALLACGSTTAFLVAAASVLSEMGDLKASMMLLELSESMASHEAETL